MLVERGADVNVMNNQTYTALHWAASKGHYYVVEELLNMNADFDAKDSNGDTPLHLAAKTGSNDAVYNNEDYQMYTDWAPKRRNCDVIEKLLSSKADVNAKDNNGETPLQWAAMGGNKEAVKMLLKGGANVNVMNN